MTLLLHARRYGVILGPERISVGVDLARIVAECPTKEQLMTAIDRPTTSGWVLFAATMAAVAGLMNIFYGLVVLFNSDWIAFTSEGVLLIDLTAWGWVLLVLGVFQLVISASIAVGRTWSRIVGVVWASVIAIGQMAFLSVYPWWSLMIITISVLSIYALTVHGDEAV
jgi:hypothetical protein